MRAALNDAAVWPAAGIGALPNWLVVSTTILPARSPAASSACGMTLQGTEKITRSADATASAGAALDAPSSRAVSSRAAGSREKASVISWPALSAWRAQLEPMLPAPITAILMACLRISLGSNYHPGMVAREATAQDSIARVIRGWRAARPDLDVEAVAVTARLERLRSHIAPVSMRSSPSSA